MMKRTLILAMAVLCAVALTSTTQAGVISSSDFSLGFGFTTNSHTNGWTTSEINNPPNTYTIGDFTFQPTLVGGITASAGPGFPDRVLGSGSYCGCSIVNGPYAAFGVSIAGSWAGDDPPDAAADPNYHIQLNITSIRIYGGGNGIWGATEFAFRETTPDHGATSAYTALGPGYSTAAGYLQLGWDPADYTAEGIEFTRVFDIVTDAGLCCLDGFEVLGTIDITYNVIPEPSTFLLLGSGVIAALAMLRRRRR